MNRDSRLMTLAREMNHGPTPREESHDRLAKLAARMAAALSSRARRDGANHADNATADGTIDQLVAELRDECIAHLEAHGSQIEKAKAASMVFAGSRVERAEKELSGIDAPKNFDAAQHLHNLASEMRPKTASPI